MAPIPTPLKMRANALAAIPTALAIIPIALEMIPKRLGIISLAFPPISIDPGFNSAGLTTIAHAFARVAIAFGRMASARAPFPNPSTASSQAPAASHS